MKTQVMFVLLVCVAVPAHAELFVAQGAKGILDVEYSYDSTGKTQDKDDSHEWRVKRVVKLTAQLAAQAPAPLPAIHQLDAGQQAELDKKRASATASAQKAQQKTAPMMADVQALMAKCGEDDACMEKAIANYGMSTEMTPELESAKQDVADVVQASDMGAPRYQTWRATAQKGTYSIDATVRSVDSDPICMELPGARCTSNTSSKGAGDIAPPPTAQRDPASAAGLSALEVDSVKKTLMISLPVPLNVLSYQETVTTDDPEERSGTTTESMRFPSDVKPLTATIKGDLRDQSGEESIKLTGQAEEGGTLTVRWHFKAQ